MPIGETIARIRREHFIRWKPPVPKRSITACIKQMLFATSRPASEIPRHQPPRLR